MGVRARLKEKGINVIETWELLDRIKAISGQRIIRDRALIAFLYLTGCRIEEVVKYILEKNRNRKNPILTRKQAGLGIMKKQIEVTDEVIMVRSVRCLKRRKELYRNIPILRNEKENQIITYLTEYLDTLQDDDQLFPITRQRAYQICASIDMFPHLGRHLRNTRLVEWYDFSASQLQKFNAWSKSSSGDPYIHLNVSDLIEKMKKNK